MPYELTEREKISILQCSVERMINTSLELARYAEAGVRLDAESEEHMRELGSTSRQDWEDYKEIVLKLWAREQNSIHQAAAEQSFHKDPANSGVGF